MKLQKLIYYAQAWSLGLLGAPFFDEDLQAWAHGPVSESVYRAFAGCGWDPLGPMSRDVSFSEKQEELLGDVADIYGAYSAKRLEVMTHTDEPWQTARGGLASEARSKSVISKDSMATYYARLYADTNEPS